MIRRLFVSDTHTPHHDARAYGAMLEMAKDFKPHEIVFLGDFFDVYCLSRFDKNPEKLARDLEEELVVGKDLLKKTIDTLKHTFTYFLAGNHEDRITRYVTAHAPFIHRLIPPMHELFELPRKSSLIPYRSHINFDGLAVLHGIATGRNCCNKMVDMLGGSVLFGHTHRLSSSTKRLHSGKVISAYSCGWLGDFAEAGDYMQHADWAHGFATGLFPKSGKWSISLHAIENGSVTAHGKEFKKTPGPQSR